jgi:hypothetical protein
MFSVQTSLRPNRLADIIPLPNGGTMTDATLTRGQRLVLRVRRRAVRCYEITLFMLLGALALGVGITVASAEPDDGTVQCGNIQSSTVVISR